MTNATRPTLWRIVTALAVLAAGLMGQATLTTADVGETRLDNPRSSDVGKISVGLTHTCAVISDGTLWCWGRNNSGQLGIGNTTDQSLPTQVGLASNWRSVSASSNSSTCAVNTSNELFCWGFNASGQTGVASTTNPVTSPTKVAALGTSVQSVSVGGTSACAVTNAGAVKCWGSNSDGKLGKAISEGQSTSTPTAVTNLTGSYVTVAVGDYGACALRDDKNAYCWGSDLWGQRGDGASSTATDADPTLVTAGEAVSGIVAGLASNCLILERNGVVRCWGQNENNFLSTTNGNLTSPVTASAAPFAGNSGRGFSLGSNFACMLTNTNGSVICGGVNNITGVGATGRVSNAPSGSGYLAMTVGNVHGCAIRSDRRLVCWGLNSYGQIGTGTTGGATVASLVTFGTHATQTLGAEPVPPSAPSAVALEGRYQSLNVTWVAPSAIGTSAITNYEYRYSSNGGTSWSSWTSFGSTSLSGRIKGLTTGVSYSVQVRAISADGNGAESLTAGPVAPATPCDPKNNCVLGAIGPRGGTIVFDAGPSQSSGRFIEAAGSGWSGSASDPQTDWDTAMSAAAAYEGYGFGWTLATSSELVAISNLHTANPQLLADWAITDRNEYWSSSEIDSTNAYAGTDSRDKTWYYKYRPIRYLDGPTTLAAPTVSVTGSDLAIAVSWTAPSTTNNGAVTDYETRVSSNGGTSWGSWVSGGLQRTLQLNALTSGASYRIGVRAINGAGAGSIGLSEIVTMTPALSPSTQTITGAVNSPITPTSVFSAVNFSGVVSYAVSAGTLPAGLSLATSTGVISGTPTVGGTTTVTVRATGLSAGIATATITFSTSLAAPGTVEGVWAIDGLNAVVLEWFAPTTGEAATGYEYAISTDGGQTFSAFSALTNTVTTSGGSSTLVSTRITTGLTREVDTIFQVRAMNGATPGPVFPDPSHFTWGTWSPRATAKLTDPCDPMNDCEVGSVGPGGGIIVYDHGFNASWGRYLESAPAYWNSASGDPLAKFGCQGTKINAASGVSQQAIGTGAVNAAAVMTACNEVGIAARLASAYSATVNGELVDDWHLPSSGELQAIHNFRQRLGGWKYSVMTGETRYYASSTDFSNDYFYGIGGTHDKFISMYVRPVRFVMGPDAPSAPRIIASVGNGIVNLAWSAPVNNGGNAVSDYQFRLSSNGGTSWGSWSSLGLVFSRSETTLVNAESYAFEIRAVNRGGAGASSGTGVMVPGAITVNAVQGTPVNLSTVFSASSQGPGVSYSVTTGTLPAGLGLNSATGVVTGTPAASGISSVTLTATLGSATAIAVVEFVIAVAPVTTSTTTTTTTTTLPAGTTTATPVTTTPATTSTSLPGATGGGVSPTTTTAPTTTIPVSQLVTPQRQEQLATSTGGSKILIGGVLVEVTLIQVSTDLREVPVAERTVEQVRELRSVASSLVSQVQALIGGNGSSPISWRETSRGAVIVGLVTDPITGEKVDIPVEHVVLIRGGGLLLMVAGSDGSEPARIGPDGVLEISQGGVVSVLAYGLQPGVTGEVVVMSKPRLLSQFAVSDDGGASAHATLPLNLEIGEHTVVVTVGGEAAALGFRIVNDESEFGLPTTGFESELVVNWSLALVVAGLFSLAIRRRKILTTPL